jgi:ribosomal protein S15P/S13E
MVKKEKNEESEEMVELDEVKEEKAPKVETKKEKPNWVKMKPAEVESLIVELAKGGNSPAKIGLILRDEHGIPKTKLFGKRLSQVLREKGIKFETEEDGMKKKIETLQNHFGKNKHDYQASKALSKKLWAMNRMQSK